MSHKTIQLYDAFVSAETEEQFEELRQFAARGSYSCFNELLNALKEQLKTFEDDEAEQVQRLLLKAKTVFPRPDHFSPSWTYIWQELEQIAQVKTNVLRHVPRADRTGEWQVVMDNPYFHQGVACYPALSFLEAVYLYSYFQQDLKKNEYIRLQKIVNVIANYGSGG